MVAVALKIKAHEWPIKSMAVLADGPRILTGSADCTVKVRTLRLLNFLSTTSTDCLDIDIAVTQKYCTLMLTVLP